jgi:hypothetical protein
VLELDLEQPDHLDGDARGSGDGDRGELVGLEDLLHVALGDQVAHGGPTVAGHDDTGGVDDRDDGRSVRCVQAGHRASSGSLCPLAGQQVGRLQGEEVAERGVARREVRRGKRRAVGEVHAATLSRLRLRCVAGFAAGLPGLTEQSPQSIPHQGGIRVHRRSPQICHGRLHPHRIVEEQPDPEVASSTEQPAHFAGHMVVVGMRRIGVAADGTDAALTFEQEVTVFDADSVGPPQMISATFGFPAVLAFADQATLLGPILVPIGKRLSGMTARAPLMSLRNLGSVSHRLSKPGLSTTVGLSTMT